MNDVQNILSGLGVIVCGIHIAGPAAATIMSDFGAEVIKIEHPPHGDPYPAGFCGCPQGIAWKILLPSFSFKGYAMRSLCLMVGDVVDHKRE